MSNAAFHYLVMLFGLALEKGVEQERKCGVEENVSRVSLRNSGDKWVDGSEMPLLVCCLKW